MKSHPPIVLLLYLVQFACIHPIESASQSPTDTYHSIIEALKISISPDVLITVSDSTSQFSRIDDKSLYSFSTCPMNNNPNDVVYSIAVMIQYDDVDTSVEYKLYKDVDFYHSIACFCVEHDILQEYCMQLFNGMLVHGKRAGLLLDTTSIDTCLESSNSQWHQDYFLYENFFKKRSLYPSGYKGFYVDVGANDPVRDSNSWFFDRCLGWDGICIEPNPQLAEKIRSVRSCRVVEKCISDSKGHLTFAVPLTLRHQLAFVEEDNDMHIMQKMEGTSYNRTVTECDTLQSLFDKYDVHKVDYMDFDIEGYELKALSGINFSAVEVDFISIENSFHNKMYEEPFIKAGYSKIGITAFDDIWKRNSDGVYTEHPDSENVGYWKMTYDSIALKNRRCCGDPGKCATFN